MRASRVCVDVPPIPPRTSGRPDGLDVPGWVGVPGRHGTARTVRGLAPAPEEETRHPEINTGGCLPVSPGHSWEVPDDQTA